MAERREIDPRMRLGPIERARLGSQQRATSLVGFAIAGAALIAAWYVNRPDTNVPAGLLVAFVFGLIGASLWLKARFARLRAEAS